MTGLLLVRTRRVVFVVVLGSGTVACSDPVHNDDVAALGPEPGGAAPSELHRPGQPCLTCHGGQGPADLELVVGGTVFDFRGSLTGVSGVTVHISDGDNQPPPVPVVSNQVGNFFIRRSDWDMSFPLDVFITNDKAQPPIKKTMTTRVGRDGGCGTCHRGLPGSLGDPAHMPGIFLEDIKPQ